MRPTMTRRMLMLALLAADALVIDCSTIAPASAQKVAQVARTKGIHMIDAPVSGGTAGAAAGTLTFIVGGPLESLELARPALQAMGSALAMEPNANSAMNEATESRIFPFILVSVVVRPEWAAPAYEKAPCGYVTAIAEFP